MRKNNNKRRILIYSHDTFGLGHIRRCRAIAHALVNEFKGLSVLILSGSPIISRFEFKARVDFVRVPGVIKLKDGRYTSLGLHIDIHETMTIRESIIRHTAEAFNPDLFIVDKEPLGLHGEIEKTLALLQSKGTQCILGLRDILDEPESLKKEWQRKKAISAVEKYYNEIWVYGNKDFYQPLQGLPLSDAVHEKIHYTGYIKRLAPSSKYEVEDIALDKVKKPYILVSTGGGKDGDDVIDIVLKAYKKCDTLPYTALIVLGPFMSKNKRAKFHRIADTLPNVYMIDFHNRMENLITQSEGIVAMGGYNTFCEILSFDKPSILFPRTKPRLEQSIRAENAKNAQLCEVISTEKPDLAHFIDLLKAMPSQSKPSQYLPKDYMHGSNEIIKRTKKLIYK